jgi:hypothetical protein
LGFQKFEDLAAYLLGGSVASLLSIQQHETVPQSLKAALRQTSQIMQTVSPPIDFGLPSPTRVTIPDPSGPDDDL